MGIWTLLAWPDVFHGQDSVHLLFRVHASHSSGVIISLLQAENKQLSYSFVYMIVSHRDLERKTGSPERLQENPFSDSFKNNSYTLPGGLVVKNQPVNVGDMGSILVQEYSTFPGATRPRHHNYWAREPTVCAPQEQPPQWEAHVLQWRPPFWC